MKLETVVYRVQESIATISLNRPQVLNALNRRLIQEAREALEAAAADPAVKVIILRGEGRAFCTGDDLSEDFSDITTTEAALRTLDSLQRVTRVIVSMSQPVIASVHGFALGAGCEWCMNCDIRIAAEETRFGFPETKWGYTVTNAGTKLLPQLIGLGRAKQLVLTGEFIDAATAERWGLVNCVVRGDELEQRTLEVAQRLLANSSLALALSKRALNSGAERSLEDVLLAEIADAAICAKSPETLERVKNRTQSKGRREG